MPRGWRWTATASGRSRSLSPAPSSASWGSPAPTWESAFTPCTEIGWRLSREAWGHGYAAEAARAALRVAFTHVGLDEVVSFTAVDNVRSRAVMERIGMHRDVGGDFDHPRIAVGQPTRRHVLYRLTAADWVGSAADVADAEPPEPARPTASR